MPERWDVLTSDGRTIAVWVDGTGRRSSWSRVDERPHHVASLIDEVRGEVTTSAMDCRGSGASPDGPDCSAEREFDDVVTVAEATASRTGRPVVLFGHSGGASCALGAAPALPALSALVLYEPSLGLRYPSGAIARIEARVDAGDHEGAVLEVLTDIAGMTQQDR